MPTAKQYNEAHALLTEFAKMHQVSKHTPPFALHKRIHEWLALNPAEAAGLRLIEMGLAYERAAGVIESSCITVDDPDSDIAFEPWYNLDEVDEAVGDVTEEVEYLDSRRLLLRHPSNPRWVRICDEGEPAPIRIPVLGVVS